MKKILFILFIVFFGNGLKGQNVNFDWVAHFGAFLDDRANSVILDASGNVYSTGYFAGSIDFDPMPTVFTLTANPLQGAGFISKLNGNKNFIWAKLIEGVFVRPTSINVDASGNVIIVGFYNSVIDLDPGTNVVTGSSTDNVFLIKLDVSGNFILGKTFARGGLNNRKFSLATDPSGNIYITGGYDSSSDFDPGPGVYTLSTEGGDDIFILKLDQNGNFVWVKGIGTGSSLYDLVNGIAVDTNGNVFITGSLSSCDFDPGPGVFSLNYFGLAPFILKLNMNGDFVWAKHFAPMIVDMHGSGKSIAIDQMGNVYIGGEFEGGTMDFDPGTAIYPLTSNSAVYDTYICKLDGSGNFLWANSMGGSFQDLLEAITLDAGGNVYATGSFYNTIDFNPGPGVYNLTSAAQQDGFIVKFNAQGNFGWAKNMGGSANDFGTSIVVDAAGSVYTMGLFEQVADFDPSLGIVNLTSAGWYDIFILKLSRCTNNSFHSINASVCSSYILNNQTYNATGTYTQTLSNASDCDSIITLNLTINRKFTTVNASICQGQSYFAAGSNQTTSGIYKDTLLTSLGCDSVITTNLTVTANLKPNLGPDRNLCSNGVTSISPGSFNSYFWQDNSTQPNLLINNSGKYWVTVTDVNNCSATDTLTVLAIDTVPKNFLPADQLICYGIVFNIAVPGYKNYLWSTGNISSAVAINSPGTYYLSVTDNNNCTGKDTVVLQRNYDCIPVNIPNAFTPNKDGTNDIFKPIITQEVSDYSFTIFNRYGQKIFASNSYGTGWDGTFKGVAQPRNAYIYLLNFKNNNGELMEYKGTVTLIR